MCILGALYRQAVLQGAFVKIGGLIKFKGFLYVEFLENRLSPEKIKNTQKIARKVDFSEPRLYNAPSLHTVKTLHNEDKTVRHPTKRVQSIIRV